MAANELEEHVAYNPFDWVESCEPDCTPERHAYHQGQWDMACRICRHFGVYTNPVDGDKIKENSLQAILSLIESEKVKAVEEYKSAQRRDIPISRGISGKKLTGIVFDESSHIDSGHLEELESKEETK